MKKLGFIFPGQGSQTVGMGQEIAASYPELAGAIFEVANDVLGKDFKTLCFEGPQDVLTLTENAQPAIFLVSVLILSVLNSQGIRPSIVAGHSLGEITAYFAAGVLGLEDALSLIRIRGNGMAASCPAGTSGMAAIMGMERPILAALLEKVSGTVVIANDNCPGQIVISGENSALESAIALVKAEGKKAIPLKVSGAFHSPLMQPASDALASAISQFSFENATCPIVLNRTAQPETDASKLRDNLIQQVISPVRWVESMQTMAQTTTEFVECGHGKVLTGLLKKIQPEATSFPVGDLAGISALKG